MEDKYNMEFIKLIHQTKSTFDFRTDEELAKFYAEDILKAAEAMGVLPETPNPNHTDDNVRYFFGNKELPKPREGW